MESSYPDLAIGGNKKLYARTNTVFFLISEVSEGTVSLCWRDGICFSLQFSYSVRPFTLMNTPFRRSDMFISEVKLIYLKPSAKLMLCCQINSGRALLILYSKCDMYIFTLLYRLLLCIMCTLNFSFYIKHYTQIGPIWLINPNPGDIFG